MRYSRVAEKEYLLGNSALKRCNLERKRQADSLA
jgi:hypothetical protein